MGLSTGGGGGGGLVPGGSPIFRGGVSPIFQGGCLQFFGGGVSNFSGGGGAECLQFFRGVSNFSGVSKYFFFFFPILFPQKILSECTNPPPDPPPKMVNARLVHILLECILVKKNVSWELYLPCFVFLGGEGVEGGAKIKIQGILSWLPVCLLCESTQQMSFSKI